MSGDRRLTLFLLAAPAIFGAIGCSANHAAAPPSTGATEPVSIAAPAPSEPRLISQVTAREQARREEIQYRFNSALGDTEKMTVTIANINKPLEQDSMNALTQSLAQAAAVRDEDQALFTPDERDAFDTKLKYAQVRAQCALERRKNYEVSRQNDQRLEWILQQQREDERDRQRTVEDLTLQLKAVLGRSL